MEVTVLVKTSSNLQTSFVPFQVLLEESDSLPGSSRATFHELGFVDFSSKPRAKEHVALTIASDELIFPTNIPNT